jgi:hypothetical protein
MVDKKARLAELIVQNLNIEFITHYSGNLRDNINIYKTPDGYAIDIPADLYNLKLYRQKGVIVKTYKGSYAQRINYTGGFSGKHVNYVDRCIRNAIEEWKKEFGIEGKVSEDS